MLSEQRRGELSAYGGAVLWSVFPVIAVITVSVLPPLYTAAVSTAFSALFFACALTVRRSWAFRQSFDVWKDMLLATLLIGIVYYGLVFTGYRFTTPGNGAVVSLMEIFFTFLIVSVLWGRERFVPRHAFGALLMVAGSLFILVPKRTGGWNAGDLLILLATLASPFGNVYAQRARKSVSAEMLMFVRSAVSAVFLFGLALLLEPSPPSGSLDASLPYLALSGVLLMGLSKILWIEAIHRISISKTTSLSAIETLLTFLMAYLILRQPVSWEQAAGILPMIAGMYFLVKKDTQKA